MGTKYILRIKTVFFFLIDGFHCHAIKIYIENHPVIYKINKWDTSTSFRPVRFPKLQMFVEMFRRNLQRTRYSLFIDNYLSELFHTESSEYCCIHCQRTVTRFLWKSTISCWKCFAGFLSWHWKNWINIVFLCYWVLCGDQWMLTSLPEEESVLVSYSL